MFFAISRLGRISTLVSILLPVLASAEPKAAPEPAPHFDTRVLVDVSGSMKRNDPQNLRVPALKLLVGLVPPESRTGIWMFAEQTRKLVPSSSFDGTQKKKAFDAIGLIHSRGQFTDIETAIISATEDWQKPDDSGKRSLIILTDGQVDVPAGVKASNDSRSRILENLIPAMQQHKAQVYTISLSDEADTELLDSLAASTNGWHESVDNADELQRSFARIFSKAVARDQVPLKDNKFLIDGSIREFSTLVFRNPEAAATELVSPDGTVYNQQSAGNISWHHEDSYDLITVTEPAAGEWEIRAAVDPDNGVFIITDLSLVFGDIPNHAYQHETLDITASLTSKDQPVRRRDFLRLLDARLQQTDQIGRTLRWKLAADGNADNTFSQQVSQSLTDGQHQFELIVDGGSFQRQISHSIRVTANPISSRLEYLPASSDQPASILISLTADAEILDIRSLEIDAITLDDQQQKQVIPIPSREGSWLLQINTPPEGKRLVINFDVRARTLRGEKAEPSIKPVILDDEAIAGLKGRYQEAEARKKLTAISSAAATPETAAAPPAEAVAATDTEAVSEPAETETSSLVTAGAVVAINALLLAGGYFGFRWYKKHSAARKAALVEQLDS